MGTAERIRRRLRRRRRLAEVCGIGAACVFGVVFVFAGGIGFVADLIGDAERVRGSDESAERTVAWGLGYSLPDLWIGVSDARIGKPSVNELGDETEAKHDALMLTLKVHNKAKRRIIRTLGILEATLEDDAGNHFRGVSYGFGSRVQGAKMHASPDIDPGKKVTHLLVFRVPPAATQYLVLTVDLAMFGSTGKARLKIPADEIKWFNQVERGAHPTDRREARDRAGTRELIHGERRLQEGR